MTCHKSGESPGQTPALEAAGQDSPLVRKRRFPADLRVALPLKIAVSVLLLSVVLLNVDLSSLLESLSRGSLPLVLLAVALGFASWLVNSLKWHLLLRNRGADVRYSDLLRLNFVGMFYNMVLPGQVGGEVVKSMKLARRGVGASAAAMSVAADRATSLFALLALGIVGLVLSPPQMEGGRELFLWLLGATIVLGFVTVVLATGRGLGALSALGRGLRRLAHQSPSTREVLPRPLRMLGGSLTSLCVPLLLSAAFQATVVYTNLLLCLAFDIPMAFSQLLWIVAIVTLLQSLPISIAGIGVREGAYVYLLQQHGIGGSDALALSLTVFGMQLLMAMAGGVLQLLEN